MDAWGFDTCLHDTAVTPRTVLQVLELKGNIRVLARMRPLVDKERGQGAAAELPLKALSEEMLRVAAVDNKAEREYEFDRVLSPDEGQEKVWGEGGGRI